MPYRLSIHDGPYDRTLTVHDPLLTVGSLPACGLRLDGSGVARRHARLRQLGACVEIVDLGSRDGLIVGGTAVRRGILRAGDEFLLGSVRLKLLDVERGLAEPTHRAGPRGTAPRRARAPNAEPTRRAGATTPLALSVAFHVALLAALWGWVLFRGAVAEDVARIEISDTNVPGEIPDTADLAPLVDPADVIRRVPDSVDLIPLEPEAPERPLIEDDPRFRPPPRESAAAAATASDQPPASAQSVIGTGGGADPTPEVSGRSFGKGESAAANRMAAGLLESDGGGGAVLRGVRSAAQQTNVWVARGDYDQAEKVLTELEIHHTLLAKGAIETHELPKTLRVLVFNCTGTPVTPETQTRIAWWVYEGGWLVTTDWGVERLLEKGLPGTLTPLRDAERPVLTKDETVGVRSTSDRGLGAGTPQDGASRWWLEDSSVPFTIATGIGAEVLVRSDDLERRHGHDAGAVAVTFPYGKGRVLHLLGHVYQQEGNVRGALLVHRLVVNFLAGALR